MREFGGSSGADGRKGSAAGGAAYLLIADPASERARPILNSHRSLTCKCRWGRRIGRIRMSHVEDYDGFFGLVREWT